MAVTCSSPFYFLALLILNSKIMSEIKHLSEKEGLDKLKSLAEEIRICMFCTRVGDLPFASRPMSTSQVDEQGRIWFLSAASSDKNLEIRNDEQVQLIYAQPDSSHFLTVTGKATQTRDRKKLDELWTKLAEAWFKQGKDDPELTAICVVPADVYYWDTKNGKMITLLKIAASAVSGARADGGVEGEIRL